MWQLTHERESQLRGLIDPGTQRYLQRATTDRTRTLEIGCGPGQYRLAVNGEYIGSDIYSTDYRPGLPRTPDVVADAMDLPLKSNSFDVVFFANFFHFLPRPLNILGEALRVLRPSGRLMLFDYSWKTVDRLARIYEASGQTADAKPRFCREWIDLMRAVDLRDIEIELNSTAPLHSLVELLNNPVTRSIYFSYIDGRECNVAITARKPASDA